VAGVTGGSNAGLGGGGLGLSGTVSLPGGGGVGGVGNGPSTLVGGLVTHTGAHGQYGDAEHKLYLESTVLERKVPEADLRQLIDLPPGLDLNEWLASHSKKNKNNALSCSKCYSSPCISGSSELSFKTTFIYFILFYFFFSSFVVKSNLIVGKETK
jgi:Mob1/phocein family